jgi:hypothetical protein
MGSLEDIKSGIVELGLAALLVGTGVGCSSENVNLVAARAVQPPQNLEDWPMFLGPRRNGTSLKAGLLTE